MGAIRTIIPNETLEDEFKMSYIDDLLNEVSEDPCRRCAYFITGLVATILIISGILLWC